MEKIGLVLEGGGVRGAYTAGALAWLQDNHVTFDYYVGISSGAGYLAFGLLNDDEHSPKNMSTIYAADPHLVGVYAMLHCGYFVDYRKIFDVYLKGKEGTNVRKVLKEKPNMEIGAYDLNQGKTIFFGPEDLDPDMELIRGACALPIASEVVEYRGHRLLDGGITVMIPIERALEKGCTKCLIITTKPKDYVRKPTPKILRAAMKVVYKECPQLARDYSVRDKNYYRQRAIIDDLVAKGKAIDMLPSKTVNVSRWKGDREKCEELYDLGYSDMEDNREAIMKFMDKEGEKEEEK
jgi:predicted patatin/cPLA2 family phospholipase